MRNAIPYIGLFLALVSSSCTKNIFSTSTTSVSYNEDLSKFRPKFDYSEEALIKPVIREDNTTTKKQPETINSLDVNKRLNNVLNSLNEQNQAIKFVAGFRIQVYVGNVRAESDAAKAYVYRNFPDMNPYVSFSQPTYRVKVGDFMTRSDAERYLDIIRMQYPTALVLPDKIEIKRGLQLQVSND